MDIRSRRPTKKGNLTTIKSTSTETHHEKPKRKYTKGIKKKPATNTALDTASSNSHPADISPICNADCSIDFPGFEGNDVIDVSSLVKTEVINLTNSDDDDLNEFQFKIHDSINWSSEMVCKYFRSKFPKLADVFLVQQIDGRSLHLLKREDVLKMMGLQLGPALKLYEEILKIQMLNQQ